MINTFFKDLSILRKISLISFILGKALSIPAALTILSGNSQDAVIILCAYAALIFISIVCSIIPEKEKKRLPDGVFHLDGITLTILNGKVSDYKVTKGNENV